MLLLLLCLLPLALSAPKPKHLLIKTADDKHRETVNRGLEDFAGPRGNDYQEKKADKKVNRGLEDLAEPRFDDYPEQKKGKKVNRGLEDLAGPRSDDYQGNRIVQICKIKTIGTFIAINIKEKDR